MTSLTPFSRRLAELIADAVESAIESARERNMIDSILLFNGLARADWWGEPPPIDDKLAEPMTSDVGTQG